MRIAALVVLVVAVLGVAFAFAQSEDREESPESHALSLELLESENPVSLDVEGGVWRALTEEEMKEVRRQIDAAPGRETVLRMAGLRPGREAGQSLTAVERITYVQDFRASEDGDPDPIMATIKQGLIADLWALPPKANDVVELEVRVTIASVVRPIATFATMLVGKQVTIELPELSVTRQRTKTRLGSGGGALLSLGRYPPESSPQRHLYLLLTRAPELSSHPLHPK